MLGDRYLDCNPKAPSIGTLWSDNSDSRCTAVEGDVRSSHSSLLNKNKPVNSVNGSYMGHMGGGEEVSITPKTLWKTIFLFLKQKKPGISLSQ